MGPRLEAQVSAVASISSAFPKGFVISLLMLFPLFGKSLPHCTGFLLKQAESLSFYLFTQVSDFCLRN